MGTQLEQRQQAVRLRAQGMRVAEICVQLKVSRNWVYKWWSRFQAEGPDGLRDRSRAPQQVANRVVSDELRAVILALRDRLVRRHGPRDRYRLAGAPTLRHELAQLGVAPVPALRTIERVLQQGHRTSPAFRLQPASTPAAALLPRPTTSNQVHAFDLVGPRYLRGSRVRYYFLVYRDVYDGSVYLEFQRAPRQTTLLDFLVHAWQQLGLPRQLLADNDWLIASPGRRPGSLNRLVRLALRVGVELVFIPEGQPWFNGAVEHFNGWFQPRLLAIQLARPAQVRRELESLMTVCNTEHLHPALGFQTAAHMRQRLNPRRLPANFDQHRRRLPVPVGKVTFLRQVRASGRITILNVALKVGKRRAGHYVRATLYTRTHRLKVYHDRQLIKQLTYPLRYPTQ
jgi:putative transposase